MFQKLAVFTTALVALVSLNASAQFMGIEAGVRQQSAEGTGSGVSTSAEMGYQFGLVGAFPMTETFMFRSGFLYTQRPITVKQTSGNAKYNFNYFDIPVTFLWKLNDFGGPYVGVNVALAASADCENCNGASVEKKAAMPLVIGGSFKFAPNSGVDVYYEALGKFNDDFEKGSAVGANLLITFD